MGKDPARARGLAAAAAALDARIQEEADAIARSYARDEDPPGRGCEKSTGRARFRRR